MNLTGLLFSESPLSSDVISKITTRHDIHDKEQIISVLKCVEHIHKKRMFQRWQQCALIHDRIHTLLRYHPIFSISHNKH